MSYSTFCCQYHSTTLIITLILFLQPDHRLLKREFLKPYVLPYAAYCTNSRYGQKIYILQILENQNFENRNVFKSPRLIPRSRRQTVDGTDALIYSSNLIICVDFIWFPKGQSTNFNPLYHSQKKTLKINPLYAFILNTHHPETKKVEFNEVKSRYYHHNEIHQVTVEL